MVFSLLLLRQLCTLVCMHVCMCVINCMSLCMCRFVHVHLCKFTYVFVCHYVNWNNCFVCTGMKGSILFVYLSIVEYNGYNVEWALSVSTRVRVGHGIHYTFTKSGNKIGVYVCMAIICLYSHYIYLKLWGTYQYKHAQLATCACSYSNTLLQYLAILLYWNRSTELSVSCFKFCYLHMAYRPCA